MEAVHEGLLIDSRRCREVERELATFLPVRMLGPDWEQYPTPRLLWQKRVRSLKEQAVES